MVPTDVEEEIAEVVLHDVIEQSRHSVPPKPTRPMTYIRMIDAHGGGRKSTPPPPQANVIHLPQLHARRRFQPPQHRLRHMHQRLPAVIEHNGFWCGMVAAAS